MKIIRDGVPEVGAFGIEPTKLGVLNMVANVYQTLLLPTDNVVLSYVVTDASVSDNTRMRATIDGIERTALSAATANAVYWWIGKDNLNSTTTTITPFGVSGEFYCRRIKIEAYHEQNDANWSYWIQYGRLY